MTGEQRIRAGLFYLAVVVFFLGLPFILSFALGYKFNRRTFKFTKTGLVALKTQPPGASIYLDRRLLDIKTPATITELLPGTYDLRVEFERHYPWSDEIKIEAGKVTRLEKIILFPLRANIRQLNKDRFSYFWIDEEKDTIYYINHGDNGIYKSDLEGMHYEKVADFLEITPLPLKWRISPDREKLAYFNAHQIGIAHLRPENKLGVVAAPFVFNYPLGKLIDVFWHSDSYHLILVTNRNIEVLELRPDSRPLTLVNLNKKNTSSYYDVRNDALYFSDSQKAEDGKFYDNLYKLELNTRTFPLQELIKIKSNE